MSASAILGPDVIAVRCIQGHSGKIANQIISSAAHMQIYNVEQCGSLCHYTHSQLLKQIIGLAGSATRRQLTI
jgi:hypothetical protein